MKQERNKPCACGSGKKYKRCCYLTPPATGISLQITQDKPQATKQTLNRRPGTTLALMTAAALGGLR